MKSTKDQCFIRQGAFGRWILVKADDPTLAWSGARWVQHDNGIPVQVQVANFDTQAAAAMYAGQFGFEILED